MSPDPGLIPVSYVGDPAEAEHDYWMNRVIPYLMQHPGMTAAEADRRLRAKPAAAGEGAVPFVPGGVPGRPNLALHRG